jgi:hypothetical protein
MTKPILYVAIVLAGLCGASLLFLAYSSLWPFIPWPNKLWALPVYIQAYPRSPLVMIYTVMALASDLLLCGLAFALVKGMRRSNRVAPRSDRAIYGRTNWADGTQMRRNNIRQKERPF